uniref:Uncharacterized protein n=1 Tax=Physcomitrium patens TaxID=3218 RepID=A0A7I4D8B6_PHYPA
MKQWLAVNRKHALLFISDYLYYNKIKYYCKPGPENKNCCLDEISIRYGASHEEITKCFNYYLIVVKDVSMDDFVSGSYIFIAIVRT